MRKFIRDFLQLESASGILLFSATLFAMLLANSPTAYLYENFTNYGLFIINEGLMTFFFLLVGLELKRGYTEKQLAGPLALFLPLAAALGGMLMPAIIYTLFNYQNADALAGAATPVATDIAFAIGVLTLFGKRVPKQLKLFLLSIAIYDDIGAILIIALFYSHGFSLWYCVYSLLVLVGLWLLNRFNVRILWPYLLGGLVLWFVFLQAGLHPTITGFLTALFIPANHRRGEKTPPLNRLELRLHPWVAYLIMPLFALANAGLAFNHITMATFTHSIVIGIVAGLFIGKQIGVFGMTWFCLKIVPSWRLPNDIKLTEIYGVALLCGIGFTMSLFLGTLSFQGQSHFIEEVRLGVMTGSLFSGLAGAGVLALVLHRNKSAVKK